MSTRLLSSPQASVRKTEKHRRRREDLPEVRRDEGRRTPGATISIAKLSELAHAWWGDRVAPDWQPHTREQNAAILERLELTGEFWRLP